MKRLGNPGTSGRAVGALLAAMLLGAACSGSRAPIVTPPPAYVPGQKYVEEGIASWYGKPYHGRRTASGEKYDMHDLTAAHRTLPLGLRAKVTNLDNGRSVKLRINDRGPFVEGRILDLSRAAAKQLRMLRAGLARVRIEVED